MDRQKKIGLLVGVIGFMVLVVWLMSGGETEPTPEHKREPYVSTNWTKKFQLFDKNPLGLYLFNTLAQAHLDKPHEMIVLDDWIGFDTMVNEQEDPVTYLFVGNDFGLQNDEIDTLLVRVNDGSDLFISFDDLTENLYDKLLLGLQFQFDYSDEVNVFTDTKKYKMINLFQTDTVACDWWGFGEIDIAYDYRSLSSFMEMSNFLRLDVGEGHIFLHTTPQMFFNYQIKRLPGYQYTEFVLNQLPQDRDIYLLEFGRLSDNYGNYDVDDQDGDGLKEDDSYFKLIFQNPPLLAALLLAILGVILFVIFRSRRTRPVVPYLAPKKDMTLAFAETITSIYFAKRNPYGLLQVQRKNFYATIQKHFFVDLQRRDGDRAVQTLAEKSNERFDAIKDLLNRLETKEAFSVNDQYVTEMQKKIHAFYKATGVTSDKLNERIQQREMIFRRALLLPVLLIWGGLGFTIAGVWLLTTSRGVGMLIAPLGIALIAMGVMRLRRPYMRITPNNIVRYSTFGKARKYAREELISVGLKKGGVIFNFKDNKNLIINYWDMSRFDRKQFKQLVSKLNTIEL